MATQADNAEIKGYECKHAIYAPAQDGSRDDLLVIKENIHYADGKIKPNLRLIKNFKRDFYITREGYRKHKDKKEWEDLSKLQKFTCTQNRMIESIGRALGRPGLRGGLRNICRSPYIYGADISTPAIIKRMFMDKWPNCISNNTVAVLDIETDVVEGHGRPIYIALTYRDKAVLAVTKEFLGTIVDPEEKLQRRFRELLGEYVESRNINLEVLVCDNAGQACFEVIQRAHRWVPDFITLWNMDFDIPRIVQMLEEYGYDPGEVFSDPRVPPQFRFFKYKQGASQKVTASGRIDAVHPADRWHVAECPASFFIIDSMCLYKRIRLAAANEPSYGLDYQLNKHLGLRKLRFEEAEGYSGLAWHEFMQKNYKIEYGIYNLFDCIGVELFDEKVKDLAQTISVQSGHSEYKIFNSQPKRLVDQLHFFCLEKGRVIATCSDEMKDELDQYVIGMNDWIITLPSHLTVDNGLRVINEMPDLATQIRVHVADLDVSAGYPTIQRILNISKETTFRELSRIRGIDEWTQRMAGVNLTASHVNAVEITCDLFKAPTFDTLLDAFEADIEAGLV